MSAQGPKGTEELHPLKPQSVRPAAIWRKIQKYLLPYHQTMEHLHSPGRETSELILNTPLSKTDVERLKDWIIVSRYIYCCFLNMGLENNNKFIHCHCFFFMNTDLNSWCFNIFIVSSCYLVYCAHIQWCEKVLGPFLISYFFACLSHLNVSDKQTNLNIRQRQHKKTQNTVFKWRFLLFKKTLNPWLNCGLSQLITGTPVLNQEIT